MKSVIRKFSLSQFGKNDEGSILVFVLVVFMLMALVGGTAIDVARHETLRASMQYNLDRAVLAAASLKQTKVPNVVVDDYMSKVHMLEAVSVSTTYDTGLNFRTVSATATATLPTMFMGMAGVDSLAITVTSSAEERIPHLEISLVLDVSGSMASNSKLVNLKVAAKQFISTMLTDVDDDHVAISIIPFNSSVSPSQTMYDAIDIDDAHPYSRCLKFDNSDFENTRIDPSVAQTQLVFTSVHGSFGNLSQSYRTCFTDDYFQILPYSDDENALHTKIDSLQANGWTAGHMGMKWGAAMLDPSFNDVTTDLITATDVDAGFANIPVAYTDTDTLKVIIMMGDGANTYEYRFGSNYRGSNSDLYKVVSVEQVFWYAQHKYKAHKTSSNQNKCSKKRWICFYHSGEEKSAYYLKDPTVNYWSNDNYYDIENYDWISTDEFTNLPTTLNGWVSTTRMKWEDAWNLMPASWYDDVVGGSSAEHDLKYGTGRNGSEGDAAMAATCLAARNAGMVVYTIGFETNSSTSAKLKACASTISHYYDAEGVQISAVFAQIAASIQKLKLTQ